MNPIEIRKKVVIDPDFVALKRFGYSLTGLLERYPDGCPDKIIAAALQMTEQEVEQLFQKTVARLRSLMGVRNDSL